ncbi:hypothetical protein DFH09DRAFT_1020909 [Mycena vulgaris]|nr:hypothetical protein DFH09DRAFT_1020909 [Mycena vulgaris]
MASACGFMQERNETPEATPSDDTPQWRDLQRSRLVETKAKIRDCKGLLERLNAEREELEEIMETFTYPVLTAPVEIISQIFLDCVPAHGRVQPSPRAVPLVLAQTCPRWRDIAHSLPQLWSSIDLSFTRTNSMYAGASALLGTWLKRTKGHPLSITLRCDVYLRHSLPPTILPTIAEFSAQWGRLEICLPSRDLPALARIRGPFPMLRSLAVNHDHDDVSISKLPLRRLTAHKNAPQLRELRLVTGVNLVDLKSHSATITTLELGKGLADYFTPFKHFPNLLHLSASFVNGLSLSTPVLQRLPPLESLIIGFGDPLPVLTLPHLRRLQCVPTSHPTFLSFLSRSSCDLQHLALDARFVDGIGLMECLRAVPSLVRLDLLCCIDTRSFYRDLYSPLILPQLRELSVFFLNRTYGLVDGIIGMLHARRDPHPIRVQLRSFDLVLNADDLGDDLSKPNNTAALQRLVADGLQFHVYRGPENWPPGPAQDDERRFPVRSGVLPVSDSNEYPHSVSIRQDS